VNIKERAKQHFSKQTRKTDKLFDKVANISYEVTGSELASLLKESKEIKDVQPEINKIQKTKDYNYAIVRATDKSGYYYYKVEKATKAVDPLSYYGARKSARFNYELQKCQGACIGEEPPFEYNERFLESLVYMNRLFEENFVVMELGRSPEERAVFLVVTMA